MNRPFFITALQNHRNKLLLLFLLTLVMFLGLTESAMADAVCSPRKYQDGLRSCIFCNIFQVVFNACSEIAVLAYQTFAKPVAYVVAVGTGIWLAITILNFISSLESKDPKSLIKTLLNRSFIVIIVMTILLGDTQGFFALALEPIFNTGFTLARTVAGDAACNTAAYGIRTDGGLPPSMGNSIICTIEILQNTLQDTMSLGASAMCVAFVQKSILYIIPHFGYLISGLLIWAGAVLVLFIFPFLLLDSVLQLAVACALLPAAIGAYAFDFTRKKYIGKVWQTFLNSMFNFIFLTIIIVILTKAIEQVVGSGINGALSDQASNEGLWSRFVDELIWTGVAWLKIVFVLILAWAILDESNSFAGKFAGGLNTGGVARSMGAVAASGAKNLGLKAWNNVKGDLKDGYHAVKNTLHEKAHDRKIAQQNRKFNQRLAQASQNPANRNADGSYTYRNKFGRQFTVKKDENGQLSYSYKNFKGQSINKTQAANNMIIKEKTKKNGMKVRVSDDGFMQNTEVLKPKKDENGNVTGYETVRDYSKMHAAGLRSLKNSDNTWNMESVNAALASGAFGKEKGLAMIAKEMCQQAMPNTGIDISGSFKSQQTKLSTDKEGRQVIEVIQTKKNGKKVSYKVTLGDNGRALTEVKEVSRKGFAREFSTDGIIQQKRTYSQNEDGSIDKDSIDAESDFTDHYKAKKHPVDAYRNVRNHVPVEQSLLDQDAIDAAIEQNYRERVRTADKLDMSEFR